MWTSKRDNQTNRRIAEQFIECVFEVNWVYEDAIEQVDTGLEVNGKLSAKTDSGRETNSVLTAEG